MILLTWNICHGGGSRLACIVEEITAHDPDVIALTEYRTGPGQALHSKDSHECMAEYHLHATLPGGHEEAPDTGYGFTNSIGECGRRLSVHLDGFSNDGQHFFGVISEGGKGSFVQVFDFKRGGPHVVIAVQQGLVALEGGQVRYVIGRGGDDRCW